MAYSLAIHVVGIVFWVGGLLVLTRMLKLSSVEGALPDGARTEVAKMVKRSYFGLVIAGVVLSLVTGVYQILERGIGFYMAQGWFHGKLTLVIVLLVVTAVFGVQVRNAASGKPVKPGLVGMMHGLTSGILLVVALLTLVGRG